jgi:hypothetical protein
LFKGTPRAVPDRSSVSDGSAHTSADIVDEEVVCPMVAMSS